MSPDMLDIENDALYFEEPLGKEAEDCLSQASSHYGESESETSLMRAYFLEPEHPVVLVAMYRYFYYQHRLKDALVVADRVLSIYARRLNFPEDWRQLNDRWLGSAVLVSMTMLRFYMLALKGAGYLQLRLGDYEAALERLQKVSELDVNDRLGARALLDVVNMALAESEGPQSVGYREELDGQPVSTGERHA